MSVEHGSVVAVSRNGTYEFSKPVRDEIRLIAGLGVEGDAHAGVTVRHRSRVRADPTQTNLRQVHLMRAELFEEVRADGYDVGPGQIGENITTSGIDLLDLPCGTILRFGVPASAAPGVVASAGVSPAPVGGTAPQMSSPTGLSQAPATVSPAPTPAPPVPAGLPHPAPAAGADGVGGAIAGVLAAAAAARLDEAAVRAVAALVRAAERAGDDPRPAVVVTGLRNPCVQIDGFRPGLLRKVAWRNDDGVLVRKAGVMGVVLRGGPVHPGDRIDVEFPPPAHHPLERV